MHVANKWLATGSDYCCVKLMGGKTPSPELKGGISLLQGS